MIKGELYLLSRIQVHLIGDQAAAEAHFGEPVWQAADHILGAGTPQHFNSGVLSDIVATLTCVTAGFHISPTLGSRPGCAVERSR